MSQVIIPPSDILLQQDFSGVATVEFDQDYLNDAHSKYIFDFVNIVSSGDSVLFYGEVSEDNGSSWKQGASDYTLTSAYFASGGGLSGQTITTTKMYLSGTGNQMGNSTGEALSGTLQCFKPSNATKYKQFLADTALLDSAAQEVMMRGSLIYQNTVNAINAIRFGVLSGTMSGSIIMRRG